MVVSRPAGAAFRLTIETSIYRRLTVPIILTHPLGNPWRCAYGKHCTSWRIGVCFTAPMAYYAAELVVELSVSKASLRRVEDIFAGNVRASFWGSAWHSYPVPRDKSKRLCGIGTQVGDAIVNVAYASDVLPELRAIKPAVIAKKLAAVLANRQWFSYRQDLTTPPSAVNGIINSICSMTH